MRATWSRRVAVAAAAVVVLSACSSAEPEPAASEAAATTSTEEVPPPPEGPQFEARPITSQQELGAYSVSSEGLLSGGPPSPPDDVAIQNFLVQVTGWLDRHLDDLQRGGAGLLHEVTLPGMLDAPDPVNVEAATTALTVPDRPVDTAIYRLNISHDGPPEWVEVIATVTTQDGGVNRAMFVFTPGEAGPQLVLAGALPPADPPPPPPPPPETEVDTPVEPTEQAAR